MSENQLHTIDNHASAGNEELSSHDAAVKEVAREELNRQIEEFLAKGGKIDQVPVNVMADPPKKPTSNYGSQPI